MRADPPAAFEFVCPPDGCDAVHSPRVNLPVALGASLRVGRLKGGLIVDHHHDALAVDVGDVELAAALPPSLPTGLSRGVLTHGLLNDPPSFGQEIGYGAGQRLGKPVTCPGHYDLDGAAGLGVGARCAVRKALTNSARDLSAVDERTRSRVDACFERAYAHSPRYC